MQRNTVLYDTYLRKSQEPDDRQVLSIPAQKAECADRFPEIKCQQVVEESFSAKAPGRVHFNKMLDRVERGEIQGIIAWHPDRLARNSVDAGRIIYLLDTGKLKDLRFCSYTFENTPEGKWMLSMVMSQAKYQVDKLSVDVKRGNRQKWEQGGITWVAPIGYINNRANATIEPDPDRFDLVRKMWDLFLSGGYTVAQVRKIANVEWGFRAKKTKRTGGGPVAASAIYDMFRNPLYYGLNVRPDGSEYRCSHEPMVTEEEFWRTQAILGKRGRPRPKVTFWPYAGGLIVCGECGCSITAELKTKHFKNGRSAQYTYYRCTKKRGACSQPYLEVANLEEQVLAKLGAIRVTEHRQKWIEHHFESRRQEDIAEREHVATSRQRTTEQVTKELSNLSRMLRRELIDEAEYTQQREELLTVRDKLSKEGEGGSRDPLEPMRRAFEFAFRSCYWLINGTAAQKRIVMQTIFGSNLLLRDKKLNLEPVGPFEIMARQDQYSDWYAFADDIRTYFLRNPSLSLPDLAALRKKPRTLRVLEDALGDSGELDEERLAA